MQPVQRLQRLWTGKRPTPVGSDESSKTVDGRQVKKTRRGFVQDRSFNTFKAPTITAMNNACRRACTWSVPATRTVLRLGAGAGAGSRVQAYAQTPSNRVRYQDMGRAFSTQTSLRQQGQEVADAKARELNQKGIDDQEKQLTETWARNKQKRRPWHRAGSESEPPSESGDPSHGDSTKGWSRSRHQPRLHPADNNVFQAAS